ncbi:MAG TPA: hypothetical protein VFZ34_17825, partial [Blastocatellia bacterium]|nr:hypothetical protein [Blastocatellia bacterium]
MATRIDWRIWFGHCATTDELKRTYKHLAREHHPDFGGDLRTMQDINAAFDAACREFVPREKPGKSQDYYDWRAGIDEALRAEIEKVITLAGLELEICGAWIWATGNTREHKDTLKANGWKWSKPKTAWYWAGCPSSGRGNCSLDDIRAMYGSQRINDEQDNARRPYETSRAPLT